MSSNSIVREKVPNGPFHPLDPGGFEWGWEQNENNKGPLVAPKITREANKAWNAFVGGYDKPPDFRFFTIGTQGVAAVSNYGWNPTAGMVNRTYTPLEQFGAPILEIVHFTPPSEGNTEGPPKDLSGPEQHLMGRATVRGVAAAILDRASALGAYAASYPRIAYDGYDALLSGNFDGAIDVMSGSALGLASALLGLGVPLPPAEMDDQTEGFDVIRLPGETIQESTLNVPDNEIFGDPPRQGGGGGGGLFPPIYDLLDTANRLAQRLYDSFDDANTSDPDRLSFMQRFADLIDAIGNSLGITQAIGNFIREKLKQGGTMAGEWLAGQALKAALNSLGPILSNVISSIISSIFESIFDVNKSKDDNVNDDKEEDTESSDGDFDESKWISLLDRYFIASADSEIAIPGNISDCMLESSDTDIAVVGMGFVDV